MTDAISPVSETMLPRYFWRRVGAVAVDFVLATVVSTVLLWPFLGNPDQLRLDPIGVSASTCFTITSAPDSLLAIVAPKPIDAGFVCENTVNGRDNGKTATLIYDVTKTENTSSQRSVSVPVDTNGNPVAPMMPQSLINQALLIVVGGILLRRFGRTPGKRLFGLKVVGLTTSPGPVRELLKNIPGVIMALGFLSIWVFGPSSYAAIAHVPMLQFLLGILAFVALAFWFYVLPVLRWRGATRYDRMLGLTVQRG